jgi:protein gp37
MAEANFRHIPNGWDGYNIFLSAEPLHGEINIPALNSWPKWVIFGAETGNRQGKIIPEKAWVDNAVQMCRNIGAAVFMKESLRDIMGDDFVQEFPWGFRSNG